MISGRARSGFSATFQPRRLPREGCPLPQRSDTPEDASPGGQTGAHSLRRAREGRTFVPASCSVPSSCCTAPCTLPVPSHTQGWLKEPTWVVPGARGGGTKLGGRQGNWEGLSRLTSPSPPVLRCPLALLLGGGHVGLQALDHQLDLLVSLLPHLLPQLPLPGEQPGFLGTATKTPSVALSPLGAQR